MKKSSFKQFSRARGFTIVELLVVIVVIGILASITLVSYAGITQRAAAVTLKSDLKNASTKLSLYNVTNSSYPADLASATAADVLPKSPNTTFQYTLTGSSYCLSATSPQAGNSAYHYSSLVGTIETGVCEGHEAPGVATNPIIEVLVVAGGGGGGGNQGGGGGGGGAVYATTAIDTTQSYTVTIGNGGIAGAAAAGTGENGSNSIFYNITAIGGGGGGGGSSAAASKVGNDGGSGGGGGGRGGKIGGNADFLSPIQGYDGGTSTIGDVVDTSAGGGGGGAGGVGVNASSKIAGNGGAGLAYSITGTTLYYAGGGGGGVSNIGTSFGLGGTGGGGAGSKISVGTDGLINTGGGGGGGAGGTMTKAGGNGGSGVVIIRYLTASMSASSTNSAVSGLYTIHTFTTSGTFTVN